MTATRYHFPRGVAFQDLGPDQDGVMMSLETGYLYRCNRAASVALASLAAQGEIEAATAAVVDAFAIDERTARRDVEILVASLCDRKLLCAA